ncbi:hypothetical protein C0995_005362 [Termitomyces sp. Mi166|nr:hypothetical protein C0995_005362 [Termitomyces sp. Mi166\
MTLIRLIQREPYPFMGTIDLFRAPTNPPPHCYEHDLESYFLVWASLHFDLNEKVRRPIRPVATQWEGPMVAAAIEKRRIA